MRQLISKTSCHARGFRVLCVPQLLAGLAGIQKWIFSGSLGVLFICIGISGSFAQPKQLSIPDTTARKGDTVLVPIRVTSLTTSDSVYSGLFNISFDGTVIDVFGIDATGTLTQSASPIYNTTTRKLAFAGSSIMTGSGVLVFLKVRALTSPTRDSTTIFFPDTAFNEGKPKISLTGGKFRILKIVLAPKTPSSTVIVGDSIQFSASGDQQAPLTWTSTDTAVGKISSTGRLITSGVGQMKVHLQDNRGLRDSSNLFAVYPAIARSLTVTVPNMSHTQTLQFNLPINISDVSSLGILSSQLTLTFNSSHLQAMDVIPAGSMTAGWSQPIFYAVSGQINIALAGSQALTGSGTLVYVRFKVQGGASGSSNITLSNVIFNENLNANVVNGVFTPIAAPTLVITPNTSTITKTDTLRFKVTSGGTPPYTWTSSNPTVASIGAPTGLLTAQTRGTTTVTVVDNLGFSRTTGSIVVNDLKAVLPDTALLAVDSIEVPLRIDNVTGMGILSFESRIVYTSSVVSIATVLNAGSLSSGFTIFYKDTLDTLRISGAGSVALTGSGNLFKVRVKKNTSSFHVTSPLNLVSLSFNEGIPSATLRGGSARILPSLVSITVNPKDTTILLGKSLQFAATGLFSDAVSEALTRAVVTWSASPVGRISINSDGLATVPVSATSGAATVTASVGLINDVATVTIPPPTSVEILTSLPGDFSLEQNYPNPFNPSTSIRFSVPARSHVRLSIYSLIGKEIEALVSREFDPGLYETRFDAGSLASGVYFYRLETRPLDDQSGVSKILTRKMLLLK